MGLKGTHSLKGKTQAWEHRSEGNKDLSEHTGLRGRHMPEENTHT